MSMTEERWSDEALRWTMGAAEARRRTHPSALMVFPAGVLQGKAIFAALDAAPRWRSVVMTDRHLTEGEDCIVLAYRAHALHDGGADYTALCSSTWVRQADGWQIIQHQQTVPSAE